MGMGKFPGTTIASLKQRKEVGSFLVKLSHVMLCVPCWSSAVLEGRVVSLIASIVSFPSQVVSLLPSGLPICDI